MAYQKVENINKVNVGQNYIVGGAIMLRKVDDVVYAYIDEKYYKFSQEGFETGDHLAKKVFEYGTRTTNILGRFMAFKLIVKGKPALYLTISYKDHTPVMIYQEVILDEDSDGNQIKNINFCYKPEAVENGRGYIGDVGRINEDLYLTVYNKSRLLDKALPKTDYVKKAEALKKKIESCTVIPLAYSKEHENIYIPGVYPQEMNKLHLISKLRAIIEDYSSAKIYFSESYKQVESKYKAILKYFKYGNIAG